MDSESEDSIKLEVSDDDEAMDTNLPNVINISRKRKNTKEGICDVFLNNFIHQIHKVWSALRQ